MSDLRRSSFKIQNLKFKTFCYWDIFCRSGRSSGMIAPSTGQTCRQIPQSMQVEKSIQYQSIPFRFLLELGWIQATGQASTQSATPSQVSVTIEWGTGNLQKGRGATGKRRMASSEWQMNGAFVLRHSHFVIRHSIIPV